MVSGPILKEWGVIPSLTPIVEQKEGKKLKEFTITKLKDADLNPQYTQAVLVMTTIH